MATKNKNSAPGLDGLNAILNGELGKLKDVQKQVEETIANLPKLNALYSKPFSKGEKASITAFKAVILEFKTQEEAQAFYDALDQEGRV